MFVFNKDIKTRNQGLSEEIIVKSPYELGEIRRLLFDAVPDYDALCSGLRTSERGSAPKGGRRSKLLVKSSARATSPERDKWGQH